MGLIPHSLGNQSNKAFHGFSYMKCATTILPVTWKSKMQSRILKNPVLKLNQGIVTALFRCMKKSFKIFETSFKCLLVHLAEEKKSGLECMTWVNDNLLFFLWTIPLTNSCIGPLTMAYVCQKGSLLCCIIRHFHWNLWSKQKKHFLHIIWSKPQSALTLNLNVLQEIPAEARLSKLIKLHHLNHQMERKHAPRIQPDGDANWVWTSNKQCWCLWASTWPIEWLYEDGGGLRWHSDSETVSRGGPTSEEGGRRKGDLMQVCERESEMLLVCLWVVLPQMSRDPWEDRDFSSCFQVHLHHRAPLPQATWNEYIPLLTPQTIMMKLWGEQIRSHA